VAARDGSVQAGYSARVDWVAADLVRVGSRAQADCWVAPQADGLAAVLSADCWVARTAGGRSVQEVLPAGYSAQVDSALDDC
jgi:hypothetical protein